MICELCNSVGVLVGKILKDDYDYRQCEYAFWEAFFTLLLGFIVIIFSPVLYPLAVLWRELDKIEFHCKKGRSKK